MEGAAAFWSPLLATRANKGPLLFTSCLSRISDISFRKRKASQKNPVSWRWHFLMSASKQTDEIGEREWSLVPCPWELTFTPVCHSLHKLLQCPGSKPHPGPWQISPGVQQDELSSCLAQWLALSAPFQLRKSASPSSRLPQPLQPSPPCPPLPKPFIQRGQREGPAQQWVMPSWSPEGKANHLPGKQSPLFPWPRLWGFKGEVAHPSKNKHFPHRGSQTAAPPVCQPC